MFVIEVTITTVVLLAVCGNKLWFYFSVMLQHESRWRRGIYFLRYAVTVFCVLLNLSSVLLF